MLLFGHIGITLGAFYLISLLTKRNFDYRCVLIGSILPDVLDKPLGRVLLPLGSGRLIGHAMAFLFLLFLIGLWRRDFTLSFASALHLIEDRMWLQPVVLFWPLLGSFPVSSPVSLHEYALGLLSGYVPSLSLSFLAEMAGLTVNLVFFAIWIRQHLRVV